MSDDSMSDVTISPRILPTIEIDTHGDLRLCATGGGETEDLVVCSRTMRRASKV